MTDITKKLHLKSELLDKINAVLHCEDVL